jgi:transcriptional regulator with XRE-family HTH domain
MKCGGFVDTSFGACLKRVRVKNEMTLRAACKATGWDPGNWSKLERGVLAPPTSAKALDTLLKPFRLSILDAEFLFMAAYNFHLGKLQERFKR